MVNQAGSQNNKLKDLDYSLESLGGGFKSLSADAYKLTAANDFQLFLNYDESHCLYYHIKDTEQELYDIKDKIVAVSETVNDIEGFYHPCGSSGWIKIADFDYTNPAVPCPGEWSDTPYAIRGCGRNSFIVVANDLATFSTNDITYSEVCGRINAYAHGEPSAFDQAATTINGSYVDGVSLTHGPPGDRTHIWSFAAAIVENPSISGEAQCPCDGGPNPPSFVRKDFFCESGLGDVDPATATGNFHGNDLLWDGEMCTTELCCTRNTPPYFHAYLDSPTSDDLDARIMFNSVSSGDDISVTNVELYIRPLVQ